MKDVKDALARVRAGARTHTREVRFARTCHLGDQVRQGDVYLHPVEPPGDADRRRESMHLGPTAAEPNRHEAQGSVQVYERREPGPLDGPYLLAHARWILTHPEHAHISLPAGWYEVTYQRDFRSPDHAPVPDWD